MSDEKIGFTEEEKKYLEEIAKPSQEKWEIATSILKMFEKNLEENPKEFDKALREFLRRNV